jgi:hypothetical protein
MFTMMKKLTIAKTLFYIDFKKFTGLAFNVHLARSNKRNFSRNLARVGENSMNKRFLMLLSFAAMSMLALSPANADVVDPFFTEALSNTCPSNCGSVSVGGDPLSGLTTLKFTFNSTIPSVIEGDVEVTEFGSSTVGDLIRFENLGAGPTVAVAFIFSDDIAGG